MPPITIYCHPNLTVHHIAGKSIHKVDCINELWLFFNMDSLSLSSIRLFYCEKKADCSWLIQYLLKPLINEKLYFRTSDSLSRSFSRRSPNNVSNLRNYYLLYILQMWPVLKGNCSRFIVSGSIGIRPIGLQCIMFITTLPMHCNKIPW